MPPFTLMLRPLLLVGLALPGLAFAQAPQAPSQDLFPGITSLPITNTPLSSTPSVISLEHLDQSQMSNADYQVVSNLSAELSKQAALANFDISTPPWHFQQIVCPAFPTYVFLSFLHAPDPTTSSPFPPLPPPNP